MRLWFVGIEFHSSFELLFPARVVPQFYVTRTKSDARVSIRREFLHRLLEQLDRLRIVVLLLRHEAEVVKNFRHRRARSRALFQPQTRFVIFLLIEKNVTKMHLRLIARGLKLDQTSKDFLCFKKIALAQPRVSERKQVSRFVGSQL